jgi:hypothetical protein
VRTLENRDLVRHGEPLENRAVRQRAALIETEQAGPRGLSLNHDGDIIHAPAKAPRNKAKSILDGLHTLASLSDDLTARALLDRVTVTANGLALEVVAKLPVAELAKTIQLAR